MIERPILFNAEMVNAILDGRKFQTRRIINPQPEFKEGTGFHWKGAMYGIGSNYAETVRNFTNFSCPIGRVGDRLWVRETTIISPPNWLAPDDVLDHPDVIKDPKGEYRVVQYVASNSDTDVPLKDYKFKKTPSIHMPRWASRILLEITNVRVERLQIISDEDAKAEGFDYSTHPSAIEMGYAIGARTNFRHTWEEIYGANAWNKNPWVWVVEFKKLNEVAA